MRITVTCLLIGICFGTVCFGQQAVSTAGGEATGAGGTVSYTLGQVLYSSTSDDDGTVTQGVQQYYEISVISSSEDQLGLNPVLSVYPNPAGAYLKLHVMHYGASGTVTYQLYDGNGRIIENQDIRGNETTIPMDLLTPSVYFLKVYEDEKEIKTFKIIKQ